MCVSVFEDNAGVIRFDEEDTIDFKVETHNFPSSLEPYGGAGTGIGGVIRDVLGTGLGARPIPRREFCVLLKESLRHETLRGNWGEWVSHLFSVL